MWTLFFLLIGDSHKKALFIGSRATFKWFSLSGAKEVLKVRIMSAREKEEKVSLESYEEVVRWAHLREPCASSRDLTLPLRNDCACTELPACTCRHWVLIPSVLTTVSGVVQDSQEKVLSSLFTQKLPVWGFQWGDQYLIPYSCFLYRYNCFLLTPTIKWIGMMEFGELTFYLSPFCLSVCLSQSVFCLCIPTVQSVYMCMFEFRLVPTCVYSYE